MTEWIDAAEAARRLGVKPATLYAYVSRGMLRRRRAPDGRRSLFNPAEVEELAGRGRPRGGRSEPVIESAITALGADRPYFRGRDALELAGSYGFEEVAGWLWTGDLTRTRGPWHADPAALAAGTAAQGGLPGEVLPLDRLLVITTALAAVDPLRFRLDQDGVVAAGQGLIAGLVDCLPPEADPTGTIAERLWRKLCPHPPTPEFLRVLEAAMVVLADHELAASTLAARVAASVRADPYAVVTAGLGVVSGPLHGGASLGVERMIAETGEPGQADRVVGERLRRGERIPGFGHAVYEVGDQRMTFVYGLLREAAAGHERLAVADALLAAVVRRRLPTANIDFAVGALAAAAGMVDGAGETIFAVARTAGWLAHALEEYERGTMIRPRARYTGDLPFT
jgi:citrate synthase